MKTLSGSRKSLNENMKSRTAKGLKGRASRREQDAAEHVPVRGAVDLIAASISDRGEKGKTRASRRSRRRRQASDLREDHAPVRVDEVEVTQVVVERDTMLSIGMISPITNT